jgi:hypothetical protein
MEKSNPYLLIIVGWYNEDYFDHLDIMETKPMYDVNFMSYL